jgi:hypothetical protein
LLLSSLPRQRPAVHAEIQVRLKPRARGDEVSLRGSVIYHVSDEELIAPIDVAWEAAPLRTADPS